MNISTENLIFLKFIFVKNIALCLGIWYALFMKRDIICKSSAFRHKVTMEDGTLNVFHAQPCRTIYLPLLKE
jgi:hypothetical protein